MNEEVILEKLSNLETLFKSYGTANKDDHINMMKRQDITNGNVSSLKIWRAYMTGAIAVLMTLVLPIFFMIVSDFIK